MAVMADHPDMITYLLDQNALLVDNVFGQNALDVAITFDLEDCVSVLVGHERYGHTICIHAFNFSGVLCTKPRIIEHTVEQTQ